MVQKKNQQIIKIILKEIDSKAFDNVSIYYSSYSNQKKNGLDDEIDNPVNEKIENNNGNSKDSSFYSFSSSFEIKKKPKRIMRIEKIILI